MSLLPQVGETPSPSKLLETLRQRQKKRAAGETQPVTQVLEALEQVVFQQSELLDRQEKQLKKQEEEARKKIVAMQQKAKADRDDLVGKIKEFSSAMELQLQNLDRKLSASRGDNKVLDERQKNLITNIDLMKEQLDLLTQEVIGE
eukprot:INCI14735.1.p2 GENE.INCI14735.1~~INCI14735.1.p2  ORF type:complete len:146 (-),score=41.32 INCI14735.1:920-1357(-)